MVTPETLYSRQNGPFFIILLFIFFCLPFEKEEDEDHIMCISVYTIIECKKLLLPNITGIHPSIHPRTSVYKFKNCTTIDHTHVETRSFESDQRERAVCKQFRRSEQWCGWLGFIVAHKHTRTQKQEPTFGGGGGGGGWRRKSVCVLSVLSVCVFMYHHSVHSSIIPSIRIYIYSNSSSSKNNNNKFNNR